MKVIFLGPPGCGKGTYASRICEKNGWSHISTGDLLRSGREDPEHGETIKKFQDTGGLVPDDIVLAVLKKRLEKPDAEKGFILDGFPRTIPQADALENISKIETVINLRIPDHVIIEKILARRTCEGCGNIYNIADIKFGPNDEYRMPPISPEVEGKCDKCGGNLVSRSDENKDIIEKRLNVYREQTEPLIKYYRDKGIVKDVDVTGSPAIMVPKILGVIGEN